MKQPLSDEQAARSVQQGRVSDFSIIVERYGSAMLNYLYRHTGSREDAEDLVQDLFVRVCKKIHTYKPEYPFKPWLYKVATNLCYDFMKKKKPVLYLEKPAGEHEGTLLDTLGGDTHSPEKMYLETETLEAMNRAIAALPEKHREVFVLFHFEGFAYDEIASMLGIPQGTVKSRLHNASRYIFMDMHDEAAARKTPGKTSQKRRRAQ